MGWVYGLGLDGFSIAVYGLLGEFGTFHSESGTYRSCRPPRERMAALLGCSVSKVDRALAALVAARVITRTIRHGPDGAQLPSEYTVRIGSFVAPSLDVDADVDPVDNLSTESDAGDHSKQSDLNPVDKNGHLGGGVVTGDNPPVSPVTRGGLSRVTQDPESFDPEPGTQTPPTPRAPVTVPGATPGGGKRTDEMSRAAQALVATLRREFPALRSAVPDPAPGELVDAIASAAGRGVTGRQIADTVAERSLDGARNPVRVLTHRISLLSGSVSQDRITRRCPIHPHQTDESVCRCCRADIVAGEATWAELPHLTRPTVRA